MNKDFEKNPNYINQDNPGDNVLLGTDHPDEHRTYDIPVELEGVDEGFVPGPTHELIKPRGEDEPFEGNIPKSGQPMMYCDSCDFYDYKGSMKLHQKNAHGGTGKTITWEQFKTLRREKAEAHMLKARKKARKGPKAK